MEQWAALHVMVYGMVQAVNFRTFVLRNAKALGLTGYVRNISREHAVEVVAEGDREKLEQLLGQVEVGPRFASVKRVEVDWSEYSGTYRNFRIGS
ncbi:MAG: acylphosphatase [Dehalococcoidia bacterium]|jgi:acylphosphatase|nr:acylphosphatase [Dehalococcoidia bacterium]